LRIDRLEFNLLCFAQIANTNIRTYILTQCNLWF